MRRWCDFCGLYFSIKSMIGVLKQKKTSSLNCARKIILGSELQETRPLQQKAEYNTTSRRDDGRLQVKEMMAAYK